MVSDPNHTDNTSAAGFRSAAAATAGESVEEKNRKSYLREFAQMCEKLWEDLRNKFRTKNMAVDESGLAENPYKSFGRRQHLGDFVYDCGDRLHLSGTKKRPVTDRQIYRMIESAVMRKDPPWETIYMFDKKGKPDLAMAARVQGVIDQMREGGQLSPRCNISCCTNPARYPENIKTMASLFNKAANPDPAPAQAPRPGFHVAPAHV